ncbi:MAG: membrane protein insertase YidC [Clostridia bacterium]|nr:membrane protein insertase YidC [Clostridia bacterium]
MFDFLAKLLGYVLQGCYFITKNYIAAIILFTLALQLLLLPFAIKQQKNTIKQASMRPKEMAIRKKYAGRNDQKSQQKCQQEIMEMYQKEGFSPAAGCLPMIIQIILLLPVWQLLTRPLEIMFGLSATSCNKLYFEVFGTAPSGNAPQVKLLTALRDPSIISTSGEYSALLSDRSKLFDMTLFGADLGTSPIEAWGTSLWWLIFIPILNLGLMYLSQFLSRKFAPQTQQQAQMSGSMKIMMIVLPLITFWISFKYAAALGVYWIIRTIYSIAQQLLLAKLMPQPVFTDEDFKQAERDMKNKKPTPVPKDYAQKEIRSLHHIDDE